jgi:hypothetical protein
VNLATWEAPTGGIFPALDQQYPLHVLIQQDAAHDGHVLLEGLEVLHDLLNIILHPQHDSLALSNSQNDRLTHMTLRVGRRCWDTPIRSGSTERGTNRSEALCACNCSAGGVGVHVEARLKTVW